ncbi:MAG: LacI family DNA-binding transcriptional regulator [Caldilineaceae bacterium]
MSTVTMHDVAHRAGVSKTTVSHVLNGTRFVEEETVARVRQAMRELGYRPNLLARSLRRQETKTIALITPDNANVYWAEFARVVEGAGFAAGYTVFLCNSGWSLERERKYIQTLLERQIDGIILAAKSPHAEVLQDIVAANIPVVVINNVPIAPLVSAVKVDDFRGGYLAGEYLASLGHRAVGCIATREEFHARMRVDGFCCAFSELSSAPASIVIAEGDFSYASGETGVFTLFQQQPDLTAIFAVNDNMALGAYKALHRLKRCVPEDVSVIGYDNIVYSTAITPELTTIAQPIPELGETAFTLLLNKIDDPTSPPETVVLQPSLIERASCHQK